MGKSTSFVFYKKNSWGLKNNDDIILIFKQAILLNGQLLRSTLDDINANGQTKVHKKEKEKKWHLTVATAHINKKTCY